MAKDRKVFNPDGEELTLHDHNWVMDGVTLHPMPDVKRPVAGATVLWRCTKRNCQGLRESKYQFRNQPSENMRYMKHGGGVSISNNKAGIGEIHTTHTKDGYTAGK